MPTDPADPAKKAYTPPRLHKLNPEQATLFLLGHAWAGSQEAQGMLELVFPDPQNKKPE